jgi:hypothetical protein
MTDADRLQELEAQAEAAYTKMYGPAARCKRFSSIRQMRSRINVSGL